MPGIKLTDEDRQRIDAKFICTLCKSLLCIPMQTMCGHLMCQSCVENVLEYDYLLCILSINISASRFYLCDQTTKRKYRMALDKNIRGFFRSSDPKCPEDGEELSKEKVSAFHRNLCGKFCVTCRLE